MSQISDTALVEALRRQMTVAAARQVVSAGNLANFDTPGYKAKEVNFADALTERLFPTNSTFPLARGSALNTTSDPASGIRVQEVQGLQERRDGNNVQLDRELLTMTRAAGEFSAAQTVLAAKFRLVRYALAEGR